MSDRQRDGDTDADMSGRSYTIADYILAKMKAEGVSQRSISVSTGYSKSRVNRILKCDGRLPITIVEANEILGAMGVSQYEVALANEVIRNRPPISSEEMAAVVSLVAVVLEGLPTKIASLLETVDGLQSSDIRKEHGVRVRNAIHDMLEALYTTLIKRKDERIDFTRF
jgi:hypothetical protein